MKVHCTLYPGEIALQKYVICLFGTRVKYLQAALVYITVVIPGFPDIFQQGITPDLPFGSPGFQDEDPLSGQPGRNTLSVQLCKKLAYLDSLFRFDAPREDKPEFPSAGSALVQVLLLGGQRGYRSYRNGCFPVVIQCNESEVGVVAAARILSLQVVCKYFDKYFN